MKRDTRAGPEERWLVSLRKALVRAGVSVHKIASVIAGALDAERMGVGEDGEAVSLGPHHSIQLKAATLAIECHAPRRTGQLDGARPILNVQAGAKVQLVFFGEAIAPMPEAPAVPVSSTPAPTPASDPLTAHLIRQGKLTPDATAPETAKAESPQVLPEPKRRDGWRHA